MTTWKSSWLLVLVATALAASAATYHRSFRNGYPAGAQAVTRATPRTSGTAQAGVRSAGKRTTGVLHDADFSGFRDKAWVTGCGKVTKILSEDRDPPCHQRFFVADGGGRTVLVAHNIDESPRLDDLAVGDVVEFKGEFVDHKRGGLVHRTHPDKSRRKPDGWLRKVKASEK